MTFAPSMTVFESRLATASLAQVTDYETPLDYSRQTLADAAPRLQTFTRELQAVDAETRRIWALRNSRYGSFTKQGPNTFVWEVGWYESSECPTDGAMAYVWPDIFETARANLRRLALWSPPRYAPGAEVISWVHLIQWNIQLLEDASNIRPIFRFPKREATEQTWDVLFGYPSDWRPGVDEVGKGGRPPGGSDQVTARQSIVTRDDFGPVGWLIDPGRPYLLPSFPVGLQIDADPSYFSTRTSARYLQGQVLYWSVPTLPNAIQRFWLRLDRGDTLVTFPDGHQEKLDLDRVLTFYRRLAGRYSQLRLKQMLADSMGFYVYNHLKYWETKGILTLDPGQARSLQDAVRNAQIDATLGTAVAVGSAVIAAASSAAGMGPIGALAAVVGAVGMEMLKSWVGGAFSSDAPRQLFIRIPSPTCRPEDVLSSAAQAEQMRLFLPRLDANLRLPATPPTRAPGGPPPPPRSQSMTGKVVLGVGAAVLAVGLIALIK